MIPKKSQKIPKNYNCNFCDYITCHKNDYKKHLQTEKHKNCILEKKSQKNKNYNCSNCNNSYMYLSGLLKHQKKCEHKKNETKMKQNETKNFLEKNSEIFTHYNHNKNNEKNENFLDVLGKVKQNETCPFLYFCDICDEKFNSRSTLWRHKKKCKIEITANKETNCEIDMKKIIIDIMKKNTEILEEVKELAKEPKIINNSTTNSTTNNTQFNIMNYLNNECKDAMNLSDFINELSFSLDDLEIMGTKGYQQSMEDTFIKQLTIMDKTKRPIHCSDKKRKSFYIKDDNIWEKDENNSKIVNGLKKISQKHKNMITIWMNYNKNWSHNERKQDFFNKSVQEVAKYNDSKQINKLISKLTKLSMK
jgi:hypothetical protein